MSASIIGFRCSDTLVASIWFTSWLGLHVVRVRISRAGRHITPDLTVGLTGGHVLRVHLLGIVQRARGVGRPRPLVDADRPDDAALEHANELQPDHLEQ